MHQNQNSLMSSRKKYLILVVGPTAVGKTSLAIELAQKLNTEIVSADSRQFFRETELGTAKPTIEEQTKAKHHFINNLSIEEEYNAGKYEEDALQLLEELFQKKDHVIMVGGSGLYVNAVCFGMDDMPEVPDSFRAQLIKEHEEKGLDVLTTRLKELDPEYYNMVDLNNPQRVIRALEVIEFSGKKYSELRKLNADKPDRPFETIWIGLELPRDLLYERIDYRMDLMIEEGLFKEAESLFDKRHLNALHTVGYSEIFRYMEGQYDYEEAVRLLKRNSRRYAKRQFTWFKRNEKIRWFTPDQFNDILQYVEKFLGI